MTFRTNGTESNHVSKFWTRSSVEDTTEDDSSDSIVLSRKGRSAKMLSSVKVGDDVSEIATTSYEYTIQDPSPSSTRNSQPIAEIANNDDRNSLFNSPTSELNSSTKRYQTKMLLASLIEHFCRSYGDTPDANRKVFFLICQTLRSLGIIDAEFVDEMTSVRSAFQQAFHKLFYTAVQTVRDQNLVHFDNRLPVRLIETAPLGETALPVSNSSSPEPSLSTLSSSPSSSSTRFYPQQPKNGYFSYKSSPSLDDKTLGHSAKTTNSVATTNSFRSFMSNTASGMRDNDDFFGNLNVQNSRYNNDFVEISLLGKGGFASAFRARNKLDDIDYAVKKIRLGNDIEESDHNKENPYEKIFREIKNLARLEHQNVIRYYSSWLEFDGSSASHDPLATDGSDWEEETSKPCTSRNSYFSESSASPFRGRDPTFSEEPTASLFDRNEDSGISHIQFGEGSTSDFGGAESNSSWSNLTKSPSCPKLRPTPTKPKTKASGWTLFIQMQLCPTTLHDYIRFRNKQYSDRADAGTVDTQRNIEIFAQILEGTAYIHDQGLIHRDLKPSNIFLSMPNTSAYVSNVDGSRRRRRTSSAGACMESLSTTAGSSPLDSTLPSDSNINMWEEYWVPKIGDFGLAAEAMDEATGNTVLVPTPISSTPPSPKIGPCSDTNNSSTSTTTVDHYVRQRPRRPKPKRTRTVGVGTRTYASPEQLAIPAQAYDEKVDIYSLGIILFELFQPFTTGMERADSIDKLKRGIFPEGFLEMYPKVSALILWMLDHKPDHRPSAHQLLEFELFSHPHVQDDGDICLTLQTQLQSKINLLEHKNKEIEQLKQRVIQVEQEKALALQEMQQKLQEMQHKLDQYQDPASQATAVKKCSILSPSASFLRKKKEVRWSSIDNI
ncbi:hypothetical protein [Parasitella parasitica]|uniref:Eukaryotic translation initiation factor 2-alpha kinase 1 n=1 Tax=Parasitella parasitica TaxID=35722 RepID=A0A0B7N7T7_9FUNG|nr:hypothetical protein [Parasitella parasitica]